MLAQPNAPLVNPAVVKISRLGSPKHYEDACEVLHKLSKSKV